MNNSNKIKTFLGLKSFALLLLFFWHATYVKYGLQVGTCCCEFFFVVSGFLVAYNFNIKNINTNIIDTSVLYLIKKIKLFYPLHVITFLIAFIFFEGCVFNKITILNLLLLQSWNSDVSIYFSYNAVSWFLSSLLFCYFIAPLLYFFIYSKNRAYCIKLLVIILFIRYFIEILPLATKTNLLNIQYYVNPIIRAMEFFMGMLIFSLYLQIKNRLVLLNISIFNFLEIFYLIIYIAIVLLCVKNNLIRGLYYIPLNCILVLLFAFEKGVLSHFFSGKFFVFMSSMGFSFFMWHQIIIRIFEKYFLISNVRNVNLYYLLVLLLFCILVSFVYNYIENKVRILIENKTKK